MPNVNLISERRIEKRLLQQKVRSLVYVITAEITAVLIGLIVLCGHLASVNGNIKDLDSQMLRLSPKVAEIQQLQADTAKMQPKVDTLNGARQDTLFWYSNLCAVTNSLPEKAWLTSVDTGGGTGSVTTPGTASGADPSFQLSGVAADQSTVGETMLRMNNSPSLDHVDLSYVSQEKIGKTEAVSFQMNVHLKPEQAPAAPQGGQNVKNS